jgi:hypothetical protein
VLPPQHHPEHLPPERKVGRKEGRRRKEGERRKDKEDVNRHAAQNEV